MLCSPDGEVPVGLAEILMGSTNHNGHAPTMQSLSEFEM